MTPSEVLRGTAPVPGEPVFAFGTAGRAVTVRSQQRRAIHLVDALVGAGVISAGCRIAIIGAGAAGMTAAVRAAHAGCRVVLLEREAEALATLRGNTTRLLHPNLYAWPSPGWANPDAQLPVLSWTADNAAAVAAEIDRGFRREVTRTGLVELHTCARVAWTWPLERHGSLRVVRWHGPDGAPAHAAVSAIILAVGFGREPRTAPNSHFPGYWDNDLLARVHGANSCLILGAGDGGMTDALRVRIRDFDQGKTFEALLGGARAADLTDDIAAIERLPEAEMDAAYRALSTAWLDTAIREHGLRPIRVTIADSRLAFGPGRFPLNKLLVSRLVRMGEIEIVQRRIDVPERAADGSLRPVEVAPGSRRTFDLALVRFGQGNALGAFGDAIADGATRMVAGTRDPATVQPAELPPAGDALAPLAATLAVSPRIDAMVEALLLYLRHATFAEDDPASDPRFEDVRQELVTLLEPHRAAPTHHAPSVVAVLARWFARPRGERAVVIARALAEALDHVFGKRLRRRMLADARTRRIVAAPNRLIPRGVLADDRRGRRDGGLESVALNSCEDCTVVIEWVKRSWHVPPRIATAHACATFDAFTLTPVAGQPPHFFGAHATNPDDHARALERIVARCDRDAHDFVVLGEFALHAQPGWALSAHLASRAHVIAGLGHVRAGTEQQHQHVAVLDRHATRTFRKFAGSSYEHGGARWIEDIHVGPREITLAVAGDDQQVALIGGEDLGEVPHAAVVELRPDVVIAITADGRRALQTLAAALRTADVAHVLVAIGASRTESHDIQVTRIA